MTISRRRFIATSVAAGAAGAAGLPKPAVAAQRVLVHGLASASINDILPFELMSGRHVGAFTVYRSFGANVNLNWERTNMQQLVARGTTPVITLQPQDPNRGLYQPDYAHSQIIAGRFDALLVQWAQAIAAAGGPVVVRPMHEGNGDWYPWAAIVNTNRPNTYVAAWRHIHNVIVGAGATNAVWTWSVNKVYTGNPVRLEEIYPGDDVVDRIGVSGYNGGTTANRGGWRSAAETFERTFELIASMWPTKPLGISETGSVEQGGSKAAWITDYFNWLSGRPDITGVVWFDFNKPPNDWRVSTSRASEAAYRAGAISTIAPRPRRT